MTLDFKIPELSQKATVDRASRAEDMRICDQTFGNLFCWSACYDARLAVAGDSFVARWGDRYAIPVGPEKQALTEQLLAEGATRFLGIDSRCREWLEHTFPGRFSFRERRNSADYIYDRDALETLVGKKLAAKRNHINYFEQNHRWETRPLSEDNLEEVLAFSAQWCEKNDCLHDVSLAREGCAVRRGLRHFRELGYTGMVLYAEGAICAFTYGEPMGKAGFCVHAEKAEAELRGAYPMINREFVRSLPPAVRWINREDDAGDEGLRRAKLSYQPSELLMKYEAEVMQG